MISEPHDHQRDKRESTRVTRDRRREARSREHESGGDRDDFFRDLRRPTRRVEDEGHKPEKESS
jgi:hypothetical protein